MLNQKMNTLFYLVFCSPHGNAICGRNLRVSLKPLLLLAIVIFLSNCVSAQVLGLVSKNCENQNSDTCEKILIDWKGKEIHLGLDKNIELLEVDEQEKRLMFRYRNDPKHLVGLLDVTGKEILKPTFRSIGAFNEGLAFIQINNYTNGFIDKDGKVAIKYSYFQENDPRRGTNYFSEGLALVAIQVDYSFRTSRPVIQYGFIDKKGKLVVGNTGKWLFIARGISEKPQFYDAKNFSEGLAPVCLKDKWGFVNKDNKIVIDYQFDDAGRFSDGLAFVEVNGKFGFIDKSGVFLIKAQFDGAGDFSEGLASVAVGKSPESWGFVDKTGNFVIKPKFSTQPENFSDGMAMIFETGSEPGRGLGYIDKAGTVVFNPQFGGASAFRNGFASVYSKNGLGYIKKDGSYLWDPRK